MVFYAVLLCVSPHCVSGKNLTNSRRRQEEGTHSHRGKNVGSTSSSLSDIFQGLCIPATFHPGNTWLYVFLETFSSYSELDGTLKCSSFCGPRKYTHMRQVNYSLFCLQSWPWSNLNILKSYFIIEFVLDISCIVYGLLWLSSDESYWLINENILSFSAQLHPPHFRSSCREDLSGLFSAMC